MIPSLATLPTNAYNMVNRTKKLSKIKIYLAIFKPFTINLKIWFKIKMFKVCQLGQECLFFVQKIGKLQFYVCFGLMAPRFYLGFFFPFSNNLFLFAFLSSSRSRSKSGPVRSSQVQSGPFRSRSGPVQFRSSQVLTWTWTWTKQKDLG